MTKTIKKGGNIFIHKKFTPQEAFNNFLNKSNITFFSAGGYGVVLKATYFDSPKTSPYYSFNAEYIATPTTVIIIKLIILNDNISENNKNITSLEWKFQNRLLSMSNYNDFQKEITMQNNVVIETINYLEPVSPVIVYSDIYDGYEETNTLLDIIKMRSMPSFETQNLIKTLYNETNVLRKFLNRQNNEYFSSKSVIGVIAMELITRDFKLLRDVFLDIYDNTIKNDKNIIELEKKVDKIPAEELNTNKDVLDLRHRVYSISIKEKLELYKNMARLNIIEIADKCGVTHADFHFGNILVNPEYKGYYEDAYIENYSSPTKSISSSSSINSLSTLNIDDDNSDTNSIKRPYSKTNFTDDEVNMQNKKTYTYSYDDEDFDVSLMDPNDKQYGGNSYNVNKGKVLLIDYGLANTISSDVKITIKTLYNYVYNNIDDIDNGATKLEKMKRAIYNLLNTIYSIKRSDNLILSKFPEWYSWIMGGYLSGGPDKDILLSRLFITDEDCQMIKSLIHSRKIAIKNLTNKFRSLDKMPFKLPLTKEEILKRVYSNIQKGGNSDNKLNIYIKKAFQTIGYGLNSTIALNKKINNIRSAISKKPYKMIETNVSLPQTISVGVGGKKKKRTRKINVNKKHKIKKQNRKTRKNK